MTPRGGGSAVSPVRWDWRLAAAAVLVASATACREPSGPVLDRRTQLERFDWWDNRDWDWYEANIPFFESPDAELDATYYYRWELVTKHLVYGSPETGYTFTEFIDRPFWSGSYGAISCPLGHQMYEARWLRDPTIVEDFARYWFETPGAQPRSYSNWYGDAVWAAYAVLGDSSFLRSVYPYMRSQVDGWTAERWDASEEMYAWVGAWDGMETNINSRLTDDEFGGGPGYRPTLNSYLYGDLLALSRAASLFDDDEAAAEYARRASDLKSRVEDELWDPERGFFFHRFQYDERGGIRAGTLTYGSGPYAGDPHGRELIGYVPWQFDLPDPGYEEAWAALLDTTRFAAPFGPTTVERDDPQFWISPRCCVWSGNAWPYATTQTLVAMENLLNAYEQTVVTRDDYYALLREYAVSQRKDGRPYIAEAADPLTGSWSGHNTFYHSEHYFHSGFTDLVITGLVGLHPSAGDTLEVAPLAPESWPYFALDDVRYHGRDVTVVWDADGTRYGRGVGLSVWVDGREIGRREDMGQLRVVMPSGSAGSMGDTASGAGSEARGAARGTDAAGRPRLRDVAVNNGRQHFPFAQASSSHPLAPPFYAVDGNRWYHPSPPNRWVAAPNGGDEEWFELDFGVERSVEEVTLYFLDDADGPPVEATGEVQGSGFPDLPGSAGPSVRPPRSYEVRYRDGDEWREVPGQRRSPGQPAGRRANHVTFPEISTPAIRVVMHREPGVTVGLTEIETWGGEAVPLAPATSEPANLAWNPGDRAWPRVRASFTNPTDSVGQAIDGRIAFTRYSRNRWTAFGSPNAEDWLELDFEAPREVRRVELFLYGDGRGIGAPTTYRLEAWDGASWTPVPEVGRMPAKPTAWAMNTVEVEPITTSRLRVTFTHDGAARTGVTELRVFGPEEVG